MARHGILIANQTYPDNSGFHSLNCPLHDAKALRDVLLDPAHGEFAAVKLLHDKTRREILLQLEEFLQKADQDDLVFIYFSGHGKTDRKGNLYFAARNTKADRLRATGINGRDITDLIHESNVSKKALVLDCCYAGAIAKGFKGADDVAQDRVDEFARGAGTYVLMATGELSLAEEDPEEGLSVLTRHMVDGLRGKADSNRDGIITLTELSRYVHKQVIDFHDQKPTEAGLGIQGDVAISKSLFEPEKELREKVRAQLAAWATDRVITYKVASAAEAILDKGLELADAEERARRALLDRAVQAPLTPGAFLEEWFRLEVPPEPRKKTPPEGPKTQPETEEPGRTPDPQLAQETAASQARTQPQDPWLPKPEPAQKPDAEKGVTGTIGLVLLGFALCGASAFGFATSGISVSGYYADGASTGLLSGAGASAYLLVRRLRRKHQAIGWIAKTICIIGVLVFAGIGIAAVSTMRL